MKYALSFGPNQNHLSPSTLKMFAVYLNAYDGDDTTRYPRIQNDIYGLTVWAKVVHKTKLSEVAAFHLLSQEI
jgi:hypothetical protein